MRSREPHCTRTIGAKTLLWRRKLPVCRPVLLRGWGYDGIQGKVEKSPVLEWLDERERRWPAKAGEESMKAMASKLMKQIFQEIEFAKMSEEDNGYEK